MKEEGNYHGPQELGHVAWILMQYFPRIFRFVKFSFDIFIGCRALG